MNEEPVERAARRYCELMGLDPDVATSGAHPKHNLMAVTMPLWRWHVGRVRDFLAMGQAVAESALPPTETPSPEARAGHRRMTRAMGVVFAGWILMALAITAVLTWWQ